MDVLITEVKSKKVRIEIEETTWLIAPPSPNARKSKTIFTFVVTDMKNGSYMIADSGSDIEYQRIEVEALDQDLIANELEELLLYSNYSQGLLTKEQIHEIAGILAGIEF